MLSFFWNKSKNKAHHRRQTQERFSQVTLESGSFSQVVLDFSHGGAAKTAQIRAIWAILFSSYAGIHNDYAPPSTNPDEIPF
jgi:hypothetical protein